MITAAATLIVVAIARWLINPSETVWMVYAESSCYGLGSSLSGHWLFVLRRGMLLQMHPVFCCCPNP